MTPIRTLADWHAPVPSVDPGGGPTRLLPCGLMHAFPGVGRFRRPRAPVLAPRPSRVGSAAPALEGWSPAGENTVVDTGSGSGLVVAFLTSSCRTCQWFWKTPAVGAVVVDEPPAVVIVTPDPTTEDRREVARLAPPAVPVVMSSETWFRWGVWGSPFFVVVAGGVIRAEGAASEGAALHALISAIRAMP